MAKPDETRAADVAHTKGRLILAVTLYVAAICSVLASFALSSILNPQGIYGLSWFDPIEAPLLVGSFAVCVLSAFITPALNSERLLLAIGAILGFAAAMFIGFVISVLTCGPLPG